MQQETSLERKAQMFTLMNLFCVQDQREDCTVRVTNLSEETKEPDLQELFGAIGPISRIYLAINK